MSPTDDLITEMRELARRLATDNDDTADDAAEQGCRLAALWLDLDAALPDALVATLPPLDAVAAVVDYLDGPERRDYRTTPLAERPRHIYRHVRQVRQWLRAARSAPPLGHATSR